MTLSPWLIYFADLMNSLNAFFLIIGILSFVVIFIGVCFFIKICDTPTETKEAWQYINKYLWVVSSIFIFSLLSITFLPSTVTFYKMLIIPTAINSQIVQKLPAELQQFIDKELQVKKDEK